MFPFRCLDPFLSEDITLSSSVVATVFDGVAKKKKSISSLFYWRYTAKPAALTTQWWMCQKVKAIVGNCSNVCKCDGVCITVCVTARVQGGRLTGNKERARQRNIRIWSEKTTRRKGKIIITLIIRKWRQAGCCGIAVCNVSPWPTSPTTEVGGNTRGQTQGKGGRMVESTPEI